jgi:hypothetical protein
LSGEALAKTDASPQTLLRALPNSKNPLFEPNTENYGASSSAVFLCIRFDQKYCQFLSGEALAKTDASTLLAAKLAYPLSRVSSLLRLIAIDTQLTALNAKEFDPVWSTSLG